MPHITVSYFNLRQSRNSYELHLIKQNFIRKTFTEYEEIFKSIILACTTNKHSYSSRSLSDTPLQRCFTIGKSKNTSSNSQKLKGKIMKKRNVEFDCIIVFVVIGIHLAYGWLRPVFFPFSFQFVVSEQTTTTKKRHPTSTQCRISSVNSTSETILFHIYHR